MKCINCSNKKLKKIVSIGSQPLSGIFYKKKKHNLKKYPLKLYRCDKCTLVQLKKTAKKKEMFGKTYEYRTSLSNLMISHIKKKIKYLKSNKFLKKKANILDIGSNDGTFLNNIGKSKNLIGIDPSADKFKKFYKKNIFLCKDFFSRKKLNAFIKQKKISINQFDVITSFAMFYDVDNPNSFCKDVELSLTSNGVWMLEFSYLPLMLKNLTYDQICHEHVAYYTLTSFKKIVEKNKMKIIDINFNEINGGSIEILCAKANNKLVSKNKKIQKVLVDEKKIKLSTYKNFNLRINEVKKKIQNFIKLNSKKIIMGYGASTKGNIVLNHCKINNKHIRYIADGSERKKGRYTPGANIKIISKKMMRKMKPDYLLVLVWSFRKEVIKQEINFLKRGGELVFHLPRFHIVNFRNYRSFLKNDFKKLAYKY